MNCVFVFSFHRLFSFLWLIHMIPKRPFHSLWISKSLPRLHFMAPAATLSLLIPNVIPKISPESGMKLHKFPGKLYIKICGGTTFASKGVPPRPFRKPVGEKAFFVLSAMRPRPGEKIWGNHSLRPRLVPPRPLQESHRE